MTPRASLLGSIVALAPALALAQPAGPEAQVRAAFDRGIADVDAGRFASAVDAFEESYRLRPVPVVLFNMAAAYSRLGRYLQAITTYERYLAEATRLPPERVQSVHERIAELRRGLPVVVLHVRPARFALTVDGRSQPVAGDELALDPGNHLLVVSAPAHASQQREVRLAPGARMTWDAALAPDAVPAAVATPLGTPPPADVALTPHPRREDSEPPTSPALTSRWWFWTGLAAVAAGGTVLALGLTGAFDYTQPEVAGTAYNVSAIHW